MSSTRVIEIFHMPIKEGVEIDNAMRNLAVIGYGDPAGILSMYWGIQLEDPTTLDVIAEWESLEVHKAFTTSDAMKAATPVLMSLRDTTRDSETYHLSSSPDLGKVLTAPVVEICRFKNIPSTFEENVGAFHEETKKLEAQRGVVNGWVIEEEKGKVMVALIAWDSVEAHGLAMQNEHILEELGKVQEHMGDVEVHHVVLRKYVK